MKVNKKPQRFFREVDSEGAAIHSNHTVQMNTVQNYAPAVGGATPFESASQAQPNVTLQQQLETLQNVVLTLGNPAFRSRYGYLATSSEERLTQALGQVIGEIDPLLLEALA